MPINSNPLTHFPGVDPSLKDLSGVLITSITGNVASADPFVYNGSVTFPDYAALSAAPASDAAINAFLLSYNKNSNPLPSDITKFVKDFVKGQELLVTINGVEVPDPAVVKDILEGFLKAFQINITGSSTPLTAWPDLSGVIQLNGDVSDPKQFAQLEAAFKDFVSAYPYAGNGSPASDPTNTLTEFFQKWRDFTAISSVIASTPPGSPTAAVEILGGFVVPTYETIFNSFFPAYATPAVNPSSPTGQTYFAEYMQQFYQGEVQRYGFFTPSHSLTNWIGYVQDLAGVTMNPTARVPETKTIIINNLLLLLISMIASIQNVAAAQADRLRLYSTWQRAYTSVLGQVHVFTATSADRLAGTAQAQIDARRDLQTNFNSAVIQRLTSQKDVVTDDAKALQSRVNQSSDAFNEQANIATALLQEMSTILSTIMK